MNNSNSADEIRYTSWQSMPHVAAACLTSFTHRLRLAVIALQAPSPMSWKRIWRRKRI